MDVGNPGAACRGHGVQDVDRGTTRRLMLTMPLRPWCARIGVGMMDVFAATSFSWHRSRWWVAALSGAVSLLGACASIRLDAEWAAPGRPAGGLRDARVLVVCEARETVIRQMCEERVSAELVARGAMPLIAAEPVSRQSQGDAGHVDAARAAGARAVLVQQLVPYGTHVSPGMSVGIGGFSVGSHAGGGVGVSVPIGGGQITTGYSASTRLTDVSSGKLLWSAKASSPPSQDVPGQLTQLTRTIFDSGDKLGVF
jgi:hypothetical protein